MSENLIRELGQSGRCSASAQSSVGIFPMAHHPGWQPRPGEGMGTQKNTHKTHETRNEPLFRPSSATSGPPQSSTKTKQKSSCLCYILLCRRSLPLSAQVLPSSPPSQELALWITPSLT